MATYKLAEGIEQREEISECEFKSKESGSRSKEQGENKDLFQYISSEF
jgi:hypothetical protein